MCDLLCAAAIPSRSGTAVALLREGATLSKVAQDLNLSESRVRHIVKETSGKSPAELIRRGRLARARKLFSSSGLLIKEVMSAVGLTDLSHFVRDYKREFGETPSMTRKQWTS